MVTKEHMRFLFKGITIDDRTREYIEKRLATLDRFVEKIMNIEVEVDLDKKGKFRVEVMVHTPRNMFRADDTTDSVEASVDVVVDKIQDQITHTMDRLRTLKKEGGAELKEKMVTDEETQI